MKKIVRRSFLIDGTPLYLERFKSEKIKVLEMDDNVFIEYMKGHYYNLRFIDNCILIDKIDLGGFPHTLKGNPKKIIDKIRYYVEINSDSYAMIDYCNDNDIESTVSVDFNSKEDAQDFEVPNWFGKEILLPTKTKSKKLEKSINIYN